MSGVRRLTPQQLASVTGEPGQPDYHGPHWARIAAKQARYAKLEARIGELMTQRADLEDEIADLMKEAQQIIAVSRKGAA